MVSVSSLEAILCKSDVRFRSAVVLTCDGSLVDK